MSCITAKAQSILFQLMTLVIWKKKSLWTWLTMKVSLQLQWLVKIGRFVLLTYFLSVLHNPFLIYIWKLIQMIWVKKKALQSNAELTIKPLKKIHSLYKLLSFPRSAIWRDFTSPAIPHSFVKTHTAASQGPVKKKINP